MNIRISISAIAFLIATIPGFAVSSHAHAHPRVSEFSTQNGSNPSNPLDNQLYFEQPRTPLSNPATPLDTDPNANPNCGFMPCLSLAPLDDEVFYEVTHDGTVANQALSWGVPAAVIVALNDGLTPDSILHAGQKIRVDARLSSAPEPYSRGKSSRGRLNHARLMPEGDGYFLRSRRPNSWGTDTTIQSLTSAFKAYSTAFPNAPRINVGDLSKRKGGKLRPHKSHQSGRDVDFGFVHTQDTASNAEQHFINAASNNLDAEKTWFVVQTLAQTGNVQVIYVDHSVQKLLYRFAAPNLTPQQRAYFFSWPKHENSAQALIQHWPGHRNHFHVRFKCPENQPGCRP